MDAQVVTVQINRELVQRLKIQQRSNQNNKQEMIQSIKDGSKEKWKSSKGAVMPAFKKDK